MRARVQRAAASRLLRAAGKGLVVVDELRRKTSHLSGQEEEGGVVTAQPTAAVVAVTHWRDPRAPAAVERRRYLAACIESILGLDVERIAVVVLTNESQQVADDLALDLDAVATMPSALRVLQSADSFTPSLDERRQLFSIGWKPSLLAQIASRAPGFYLAWSHKILLDRAFRDPQLSLLIYLEDDIRFTDESLAYWCRYRKPLAKMGLLPGFVRYEERDGVRYVVDQVRPQVVRREIRLPGTDGEPRFTDLENPYQGMYVVDRPLAVRHLRRSRYRGPLRSTLATGTYWNVRERASAGPIYDDVPAGFHSRVVVPIRNAVPASSRLDPVCLLEHMGRTYIDRDDSPFGKLPVERLFEAA